MRYSILGIFLILSSALFAQENHFSQFYNSPQYINPAFAGDAAFMKAGTTSRLMKPIEGGEPFLNTLLQADYKMINYHSGLGISIYRHTELFTHTKIQANYSYTFQMSKTGWAKGGIGISYNHKNSNANSLKFPDQYNNQGFSGNPTSEPALNEKSSFPAVAAGLILYNKYVWFSLSGDYLNHPTENFAGTNTLYPIKFSGSAGFLLPFDENKSTKRRFSKFGGLKPYSSIGPVFSYIQQGKYTEISGGIAGNIQPFYGGIHLRYQHNFLLESTEYAYRAVVFLLGYRQEEFTLAYSYDLSLSNYTINRNGAHELSIVFYFSQAKEDFKRHQLVPIVSQMLY